MSWDEPSLHHTGLRDETTSWFTTPTSTSHTNPTYPLTLLLIVHPISYSVNSNYKYGKNRQSWQSWNGIGVGTLQSSWEGPAVWWKMKNAVSSHTSSHTQPVWTGRHHVTLPLPRNRITMEKSHTNWTTCTYCPGLHTMEGENRHWLVWMGVGWGKIWACNVK